MGFAGHRVRVPPDPIPNSEVKPRSVFGCSVVFGHVKPRKLAAPLNYLGYLRWIYPKLITKHLVVFSKDTEIYEYVGFDNDITG